MRLRNIRGSVIDKLFAEKRTICNQTIQAYGQSGRRATYIINKTCLKDEDMFAFKFSGDSTASWTQMFLCKVN